ncbi:MAG: efflux RND transporter permease subunit [Actinomycetota bacterium]
MRTFFDLVERLVTRRPRTVVLAIIALTVVFAGFASQSQTVEDDAATIESPAVDASEVLDEAFGDTEDLLQVIVSTPGRDVRNADALTANAAIVEAIEGSDAADRLSEQAGRPAVLSFLSGAQMAAGAAGLDPAELDDDAVAELDAQAAEMLPAEVAEQTAGLLGDGDPPESGLVLAFIDTEGLDEEAATEVQRTLADAVAEAEVPAGVDVEPFSFALLFDDSDVGPEVGRLFGIAAAIILAVLFVVYWVTPAPGSRAAILRRTAADVGLTLAVILVAIVWMQGSGVILGPDFLGLSGYFSPQTQIVPILIIGLGVDYAIHVSARYREELGAGRAPDAVVGTALRTVGVALVLATGTTVVGFLTNLASPVEFLRTFGVLAAAGILAAFIVSVTLLPAGRLLLDRRAAAKGTLPVASLGSSKERLLPRLAERTSVLAERAPVATIVVAVALAGLGGYGYTQLETEFSVTDFVPQDSPTLEVFDRLQEDFGGGFAETTEVLIAGDLATPEAHNAVVDSVEGLADLDDVGQLGEDADADSIVSALGFALGQGGEELGADLAELGLAEDGRVADDADVDAIYDRLLEAAPEAAGQVLAEQDEGYVGRVVARTSAGESAAGELADELAAAFAPATAAGLEVTPTSQEIVQAGVTSDIEDSQLVSLAVALGAAMLLLVINFWITARRPVLGVLTIAPVGLVLAYTFGMMAATGIPLTPVTATLAALAIGIGVPFTIHVTHRFQEMRLTLPDVNSALRATARRTGGALAGSALTTVVGFGVLTTSTLVPFSQLGFVTVYAIGFALLAAILVLPSLLVLWDRFHRRMGEEPFAADPLTAAGLEGETAPAAARQPTATPSAEPTR